MSLDAVHAHIAGIEAHFAPSNPDTRGIAQKVPNGGAFEAALQAASGGITDLQGTRATSGAMKIPAELMRYGNGKIPKEALSLIGVGQHRLSSKAAQSFRAMRAAAATDGIEIGVTDSYRDLGAQEALARQKGLYSQGGLAARPGTSNHGWGLALDVKVDAAGLSWMRLHAAQYGFVGDVPREPWHWDYKQ